MSPPPLRTSVLIVGAGPTGLVLALWLTHLGVAVRIVDKASAPGQASRAVVVQARILELYRPLGLDQPILAAGHKVAAANFWVRGRRAARARLGTIDQDLSPYPDVFIYPQDEHERLLEAALLARGVSVERGVAMGTFTQDGAGVSATVGGRAFWAEYLVGCDGAHSVVREAVAGAFPGGTYERLVGTVRDAAADPAHLTFADVSRAALEGIGVEVLRVNWFSAYRVHHRVAAAFRNRRAFLAGDAAHIHSPVGGQGMNTGIGDAINLAWKLAAVLQGRAGEGVLDTYDPERRAFALRLVATTDRAFTAATSPSALARTLRTRVFPTLAALGSRLPAIRTLMFRTVSQIAIAYRGQALSSGAAGRVRGGDRLPWVRTPTGDNFEGLDQRRWSLVAHGEAPAGLAAWCDGAGVTFHAHPWSNAAGAAGLQRGAAYLLRPDSYVALAGAGSGPELDRYFAERGMTPAPAASLQKIG